MNKWANQSRIKPFLRHTNRRTKNECMNERTTEGMREWKKKRTKARANIDKCRDLPWLFFFASNSSIPSPAGCCDHERDTKPALPSTLEMSWLVLTCNVTSLDLSKLKDMMHASCWRSMFSMCSHSDLFFREWSAQMSYCKYHAARHNQIPLCKPTVQDSSKTNPNSNTVRQDDCKDIFLAVVSIQFASCN